MENTTTIYMLLVSYTIIFLGFVIMNKLKPGIAFYQELKQNNLPVLNCFHCILILIMLMPTWTIKTQPVFLLIFPDRMTIAQATAFLISFGLISFLPWKKFTRQTAEDVSLPVIRVSVYASLRIIFLMAYEWFFRGVLLLGLCNWLGTLLGIAVNTFLYVTVHLHKKRNEMLGCIPLGILLCIFTLWWQSIWPAIIFHLQVAIINEWPALQQFLPPQKQTAL
jgi:membrane protease YdiL (CAAX protease family)